MNDRYFELLKERPEWFSNVPGGIEILTDTAKIKEVEEKYNASLGVIYEDEYITLIKDAVRFPDGAEAPYVRIYHKNSGGVSIFVVCDGKILLLRHFRHSLRTPIWETPRGFGEDGQSTLENAVREMREEIGVLPTEILPLGRIVPDAGIVGETVNLYFARIEDISGVLTELHEGIVDVRLVEKSEMKKAISNGEIVDGITISSLAIAEYKGLI